MSRYQELLSIYSNYTNYNNMLKEIEEINMGNKEEKEYWTKVVENGTKVKKVENFLLIYPDGIYADKAKNVVKQKSKQKYFIFSLFVIIALISYFFYPKNYESLELNYKNLKLNYDDIEMKNRKLINQNQALDSENKLLKDKVEKYREGFKAMYE